MQRFRHPFPAWLLIPALAWTSVFSGYAAIQAPAPDDYAYSRADWREARQTSRSGARRALRPRGGRSVNCCHTLNAAGHKTQVVESTRGHGGEPTEGRWPAKYVLEPGWQIDSRADWREARQTPPSGARRALRPGGGRNVNPQGWGEAPRLRVERPSQTDAAGNLEAVMVYGHDLISQDRADGAGGFEMSFYSYDGLGSVRGLTDSIGTSLGHYHYDAYGTKIEDTVTVANPYLFAGERFDNDLGLYYLRARYLDTDTGRFWTLDSIEATGGDPLALHKYLYANGNPIGFTDPSGNASLAEVAAVNSIISGFISLGFKLLSSFSEEGFYDRQIHKIAAEFSTTYLAGAIGGAAGGVVGSRVYTLIKARALEAGLRPFWGPMLQAGARGGASAGASSSLLAEIFDYTINGKELTFESSVGSGVRVMTSTIGGLVMGGIFCKFSVVQKGTVGFERPPVEKFGFPMPFSTLSSDVTLLNFSGAAGSAGGSILGAVLNDRLNFYLNTKWDDFING